MDNDPKPSGRAERVTPHEAISAPAPVVIEAEELEPEAVVPEPPPPPATWVERVFGRRRTTEEGGHVDKTTSIERVAGMVSQGAITTRLINITVFILVLIVGLALIAKLMSPAALEGGMQEGNEVIQDVLQPQAP